MSSSFYIAQKVDDQRAKQEGKVLSERRQAEQARYEVMKANGDPQGYYFSAIVYASKHIEEPDNVYATKKLYEEAVAKGSNDAKVALGNLLIRGRVFPFRIGGLSYDTQEQASRLPVGARDIKRGVALLAEAVNKSCSYQQPFEFNESCHNERSLNSVTPLYEMYRDGVYDRKGSFSSWTEVVPKNPKLAEYWKKRRDQCDIEITQSNDLKKCH